MGGPRISIEAHLLGVEPPAERFRRLTLFSATEGTVTAFQRVSSKKPPSTDALDLFDRLTCVLSPAPSGDAYFLEEARLLERPAGIGADYERLRLASLLARCIARNPVAAESRPAVSRLLSQAFAAFARSPRPDIVYFKSLCTFLRDEGYPLRQHWLAQLTQAEQTLAQELLRLPVDALTSPAPEVAALLRRLDAYLRGHTEFFLPPNGPA